MNSVTLSAKAFCEALGAATIERKTSIPVLSYVLIQVFGPVIRVIGTDLDKTTFTEIPAVTEGVLADFLVPCRKALDLLKGETELVTITTEVKTSEGGGHSSYIVRLAVSGCEYELNSMSPANYPVTPEIPEAQFMMTGDSFKTLLTRTSFAISAEESRYTLNGALFEVVNQSLKIVATDGHRLALDRFEVEGAPNGKAIIPRPVIEWVKSKLGKTNIHVALGEEFSCFIIDHLRTAIVFKNLPGQFPNYEAVLPRRDCIKTTIQVAALALHKSLTKVAQCANERSGAVMFSANGAFKISASSTDTGTASATIPALIEGDEVTMGFSAYYMLDFLKAAGDTPVTINLNTAQNAGLMECPELPGYSYVLMPMRT